MLSVEGRDVGGRGEAGCYRDVCRLCESSIIRNRRFILEKRVFCCVSRNGRVPGKCVKILKW